MGNKFNDNIFPLRGFTLEKINRVQDFSTEILNLMDNHNDFTVEETLSTKVSIFTETKLWIIHSFAKEHNSSNLQQSSKSILICEKDFSIILNALLTKTLLWVSNIRNLTYLKSLLRGSALSMISAFKISNENFTFALNLLKERLEKNLLKWLQIQTHVNKV